MADPIWQSACKECFPRCGYKGPRFKNCEKRIQRIEEIGGLSEPPPMKSVKGESVPKKISSIKNLHEVIKAARAICKSFGIEYERELMTKNKDKKVVQTRQHVIISLSKQPYNLKPSQVASYLSISQQYISHVLNHHKYIVSTQHPEIEIPVGDKEGHILAINFNGQEDLLNIVKQLAAKELRPINLQLLHMIKSQAQLLFEEYELDKNQDDYSRTFGF